MNMFQMYVFFFYFIICKFPCGQDKWLDHFEVSFNSNETINQSKSEEFYFPSLQHKSTEFPGTHLLKISGAMKKRLHISLLGI